MPLTTAAEKPSSVPSLDALSLYAEIAGSGPNALEALCVVQQRGWYDRLASFDPRSGLPLVRSLSDVCRAVLESPAERDVVPNDLLGRIVEHVRDALAQLIANPRSRIVRGHQLVPIGSARELDSTCIDWLSRQVGGTVREKLAGRTSLLAVKRKPSLDTAENRLLLTLTRYLLERLQARQQALGPGSEALEALCDDLERWLNDPQVLEIGHWGHVPPNNTLLQHRLYRPVWDAWQRLQSLDDDIAADLANLGGHWMTMLQWELVARLHARGLVRFTQQPCAFDYYRFGLSTPGGRLEGLHVPRPRLGRVLRLSKDRNDQSMGFLKGEDDRDLFFHSSDFVHADAFAKVRVGTRLVYEFKASPKGDKAVRLALEPQPWLLGLAFDAPTSLRLDAGPQRWQLTLQVQGGQGRLLFDDRETQWPLTPQAAADAAEQIILALFPKVPAVNGQPCGMQSSPFTLLDLTDVCPRLLDEHGARNLDEPLAVQFWSVDGERIPLELGPMRAVALASDVTTVSLLSILGSGSTLPLHRVAAQQLTARLRLQLGPTRLTYLVHDALDDFASETLRSALNARFDRPEPLPRSVAMLFAWLSGEGADVALSPGDAVLALDCAGDTVSLTPLMAVPRDNGRALVWERHPPILVGNAGSQVQRTVSVLRDQGTPHATSLAQLFDSAAVDPARSWQQSQGDWFTPAVEARHSGEWSPAFLRNLQVAIEALPDKAKWSRKNTYLLVGATFKPGPLILKSQGSKTFSHQASVVEGAWALAKLQQQSPDQVQWREYLPELSIRVIENGYFKRLYLVRGQAVMPQRGVPVPIPVAEGFTLPACVSQYRFALRQGGESSRLQQEAVLSHPLLPLSVDVRVRLSMAFTYGNDNPYELVFMPIDEDRGKAGFERIMARWQPTRLAGEGQVPGVPLANGWAHWMSADSGGGTSAVEKLLEALDRVLADGQSTAPDLKRLSGSIRAARYHASRIWAQGRSLQEPTCDAAFHLELMTRYFPTLGDCLAAWERRAASGHEEQRIHRDLLAVVCALHGDLPDTFTAEIVRLFNEDWAGGGRKKLGKAFAHAVGDAGLPWQQHLLSTWQAELPAVRNDQNSRGELIEVLRVALWYSPALLERFTHDDLEALLDLLHVSMSSLSRLLTQMTQEGKPSPSLVRSVARDCELLLALLRIRRLQDAQVSGLLAPSSQWCRRFAFLVDNLTVLIAGSGQVMKSRITLDAQKPENLYNTPDLLYSLGLYLTGDSGADSISVTEVSDDDE